MLIFSIDIYRKKDYLSSFKTCNLISILRFKPVIMSKKYLKLSTILKKLLFTHDMKAVDLAREVNVPPPTIHRLITGKSTRPYQSSLKPIAEFFQVSVEQLLGEQPLLETAELATSFTQVPFIEWTRLLSKDTKEIKEFEKIPFSGRISHNSFATKLSDSSMEPVFSRGSLLIFDRDKAPKDRSYVLAHIQNASSPVFRQLIVDLDHRYLKPLNPDLNIHTMRLLTDKDQILGTLVEARQSYQEN
jgi:SOS-response transcriptional repressor LexA